MSAELTPERLDELERAFSGDISPLELGWARTVEELMPALLEAARERDRLRVSLESAMTALNSQIAGPRPESVMKTTGPYADFISELADRIQNDEIVE